MKRASLSRLSRVIVSVCISILISLLGNSGLASEVYDLTLGTTDSKSGMYPWLCAHATEVNKRFKEIRITAVESPNSCVENSFRIFAGEMHMGWGGVGQMYQALQGLAEFKGKANPNLRAVACVIDVPFTIFVTKESGIKSIYELKGKKFGTSFPASLTGAKARKFFDAIGVKPEFFEASMGATIEAVKNRSIVGFVKTGAPDSSILDIASLMPITILSITKEDYSKFEKKYPDYAEGTSVIPAGAYPGQDKDVLTYSFFGTWQATAKLPTEVVYKIVKAWYDARVVLAGMYKAANKERGELGFPKLTIESQKIPIHVGAIKFYRELGLSIPINLIPPEAK
jgi:TRAP transporter TAXI family solute receptor